MAPFKMGICPSRTNGIIKDNNKPKKYAQGCEMKRFLTGPASFSKKYLMMNVAAVINAAFIWARIGIIFCILVICKGVCLADGNHSFRVSLRAPMSTINLTGVGSEPANNGAEGPLSDDTARPESGRPNSL